MAKAYPIILTPTQTGYVVTVPDLDINTQGKDIAEASIKSNCLAAASLYCVIPNVF